MNKLQQLLALCEGRRAPSFQAEMYFNALKDKLHFTNFDIEGSKVEFYNNFDKTDFKLTFDFTVDEDGEVSLKSVEIPSARGEARVVRFGENKAKSELEIEQFIKREFGNDILFSYGEYRSQLLADKIEEYSESRGTDIQERLLEELKEIDFLQSKTKGEKSLISSINPENVKCKVLTIGEALKTYNSLSNLKYDTEKHGKLAPVVVSLKFEKEEEAEAVFNVLKKADSSEVVVALLGDGEEISYIEMKPQSSYNEAYIVLTYSDFW